MFLRNRTRADQIMIVFLTSAAGVCAFADEGGFPSPSPTLTPFVQASPSAIPMTPSGSAPGQIRSAKIVTIAENDSAENDADADFSYSDSSFQQVDWNKKPTSRRTATPLPSASPMSAVPGAENGNASPTTTNGSPTNN